MEVLRQLCYLSEAERLRQHRTRGQRQRLRVLPQVAGQALPCEEMPAVPLLVLLLLLARMQRTAPTESMELKQRRKEKKTEELVAKGDDE